MGEEQGLDGEQHPDSKKLVWALDPTAQALHASHQRQCSSDVLPGSEALPEPLCSEIGRRLLLAEVQFNRWVVRRVEKISFDKDRNVTRRLTIDFNVHEDAPLISDKAGDRYWIVPISLMRRRTLVNMRIADEDDHVLPIPGIRLAQQLDESVLVAAILSAAPELIERSDVRIFIRDLVAGRREQAQAAMQRFEDSSSSSALGRLAENPIVRAVVYLLRRNFFLYVFIPAGTDKQPRSRHRLLNLEFSEPTGWSRMRPRFTDSNGKRGLRDTEKGLRYTHDDRPLRADGLVPNGLWLLRHGFDKIVFGLPSALGMLPTRIRIHVPGAENAASYHLEVTAPEGIEVISARLLAGRPNQSNCRYTHDRVLGHTATVGLHGVEVPNGSLCQAQLDFRVSSRGWLTGAVFACGLVALGLWSLQIPAQYESWSSDRVTNVIALLITTAAAVGAIIAHSSFSGVAARMISRLRFIAAVAVAQPVVAAGALAYAREGTGTSAIQIDDLTRTVLWVSTWISCGVFLLIGLALALSLRAEWRGYRQASPWDMTADDDRHKYKSISYVQDFKKARFHRSSVGILSAEGWQERYAWTTEKQAETVQALKVLATTPAAGMHKKGRQHTVCAAGDRCPYHRGMRPAAKDYESVKDALVRHIKRPH